MYDYGVDALLPSFSGPVPDLLYEWTCSIVPLYIPPPISPSLFFDLEGSTKRRKLVSMCDITPE